MQIVIALVLGVLTSLTGWAAYTQNTQSSDPVGGALFAFPSQQLAPNPQANYILQTNGTTNSWVVNSGGGGGGGIFSTTTAGLAYTNSWDTVLIGGTASSTNAQLEVVGELAAEYFTATSTTATSTLPELTATNVNVTGYLLGTLTGNADTATALFANAANCAAGNAPRGVDQNGAVENCFDVWTEAENTAAAYIALTDLSATYPIAYNSGTGAFTWAGIATSSAIAANEILFATGANTFAGTTSISSAFIADDFLRNTGDTGTGTFDFTGATLNFAAGVIDAITEIASGLKSGLDATLITGTAGTNGNIAQWNGDGDLVDASIAASNVGLANGDTWTGVHDFGGATSFEIVNGTAPTVDATGEMAWDTTSGQLKIYDGSAVNVFMDEWSWGTTLASSSLAYDGSYGAAGTTTVDKAGFKYASTITEIYCETDTGTTSLRVGDGTNWSEFLTCVPTGDTQASPSNGSFTAREGIQIQVGTQSGDPNKILLDVTTRWTAD